MLKLKETDIINDITLRILKELNKQNKSVYQLCKAIGMHEGSFSNTKKNKNSWNQAITISKIADFLNISERYIITGKKEPADINSIIEDFKKKTGILEKELLIQTKTVSTLLETIKKLSHKQ